MPDLHMRGFEKGVFKEMAIAVRNDRDGGPDLTTFVSNRDHCESS